MAKRQRKTQKKTANKRTTKKKATRKKTTKKSTRKIAEKKPTKKKVEEVEVDIKDIINETAKLLALGVPKKDIIEVMKDAGLPKAEIDEIMNSAMEIYLSSNPPIEEPKIEYYEPNGWIILITVAVLVFIAIMLAIWIVR